ncbi:MAG: hypothetical protein AB1916_04630 [Thermodesulfobacteriota bacterium]
MAVQAMGGFAARAMAGKGAMQQQQVQEQTQARAQTQARTRTQTRTPEMASGQVMNTSDLGGGQQGGGQMAASGFGGAEIQFSERPGVSFGGKG